MDFLISSAHAQAAAPQAQNPIMSMVPFVLIFVVFYFLMIKPQKKKMQQEQDFIKAIKKGDDIYTKSGILGKIWGMNDKVVTLEVEDGSKFKILRSQIAGLSKSVLEPETAKKK